MANQNNSDQLNADDNRWTKPSTYFTGTVSMLLTYPALAFLAGLVLAYFTA
ncbi:hypothetical protein [Gordonia rubripertincta]|uniref:hypothetical protein n=1 Tax=Gordonia rubripertincta TaxID=36822 RepID=UPI0015F96D17|nr:hypothetical protein [Gordonia rubripertincta]QMU21525.1 hypothetical protein H3V45_03140 [Gordonia rubripertincta]